MKTPNPKVDPYFEKAKKWRPEMERLRAILLDSQLTEELKWGSPCYTFQDGNVVLIWGLKGHCALAFPKGALLKDPRRILVAPGANSQSMRKILFTTLEEIIAMEPVLKAYIQAAIEVQKAGLEVPFKKASEFVVPEEFQKQLDKNSALKTAFEKLTPGRQRGYLLFFAAPKQSKTRDSRIEKCKPQILKGRGLQDR